MFKDKINKKNLFLKLNISIISGCLFMVSFYYTITGVVGRNIDILNILSLLFTFLISFYLSDHIVGDKSVGLEYSLIVYFSLIFLQCF